MKIKIITACIFGLMSVSAFAMSDQKVCEEYGIAIASNNTEGQVQFLSELNSRVENGLWTLDSKQCNDYIEESKHEYNLVLALHTWSD
ncbi:hypothetical protein LRP52_28300 [Photobacterium sp. ZSDE20]|uniref:Uncharacterized protein n=1 Tax=Photobacterium pectinilyticum TaxID=2906793 RepID=A0ABT1N727_9GAMM|nr:hypothetical protein [Photobacterium sp. ZSDE20]MCQ1059892.1 hypothetical protein [Photobacterium sp. ZSDE20]MDD1826081.1 hypothetical protein [Photobacterium sp. ZSDE20]